MAIEDLPLVPPAVLTERGALRPERAILYNRPFLLLWHYARDRQEDAPITEAELVGIEKTARRLQTLLRLITDPSSFRPLRWPTPESITFRTADPPADLEVISRRLQQAETLHLSTLDPAALIFRRC